MNRTTAHVLLATVLLVGCVGSVHADEIQDLKNQNKALQQRVEQLQRQLEAVHSKAIKDDPWQQMRNIEQQMDRAMKESIVDFNPQQDIKTTPEAYVISMDIPGMDKNKINIEVKQGNLIVSGVRESEIKKSGPEQFYLQERSFGSFLKTVPLPDDAKTDKIDAEYNNGVLVVKVARNQSADPAATTQKIQIK